MKLYTNKVGDQIELKLASDEQSYVIIYKGTYIHVDTEENANTLFKSLMDQLEIEGRNYASGRQ